MSEEKKKNNKRPNGLITLAVISFAAFLFFSFNNDFFDQQIIYDTDIEDNSQGPQENPNVEITSDFYEVLKVVDGDTIKVNVNNQVITIRMIGINSPESADPRRPVECFGKESTLKLVEILENKKVKLLADSTQSDKDQFDRYLRYVVLEDETDVNQEMIQDGYAYEFTYDIPYVNQTKYKEAQALAKQNNLGLWNQSNCPQE